MVICQRAFDNSTMRPIEVKQLDYDLTHKPNLRSAQHRGFANRSVGSGAAEGRPPRPATSTHPAQLQLADSPPAAFPPPAVVVSSTISHNRTSNSSW
jgi:hypothetical protein